jgi:hypothetical protein
MGVGGEFDGERGRRIGAGAGVPTGLRRDGSRVIEFGETGLGIGVGVAGDGMDVEGGQGQGQRVYMRGGGGAALDNEDEEEEEEEEERAGVTGIKEKENSHSNGKEKAPSRPALGQRRKWYTGKGSLRGRKRKEE